MTKLFEINSLVTFFFFKKIHTEHAKRQPVYTAADCRHNIKGNIDVVKYMLGCMSQGRKTELENNISHFISSIQTAETKEAVTQIFKYNY